MNDEVEGEIYVATTQQERTTSENSTWTSNSILRNNVNHLLSDTGGDGTKPSELVKNVIIYYRDVCKNEDNVEKISPGSRLCDINSLKRKKKNVKRDISRQLSMELIKVSMDETTAL